MRSRELTACLFLLFGACASGPDPEREQEAVKEYQNARTEAEAGRHESALEILNRALEISPAFHQAYAARATAHEKLGRRAEAEDDFAMAIESAPEERRALYHFNRARFLQRIGKRDEAESDYNAAINLQKEWPDPEHLADYYLGRALFRLETKQAVRCIEDCEHVLSLRPDDMTRRHAEELISEARKLK